MMKKAKLAIICVMLLGVLAGCGKKASARKLTISTFGIATKQMKQDVLNPFATETKTKVSTQFGDSSPRFTQIEHNPNSSVDAIELSQNNALTGVKKNMWAKLDVTKIKEFKNLSSAQQKLAKETNSIPYTLNSIGIIYNSNKTDKITSWDQLWDKKYRGKIAIPDISTTFGPAMLYLAGEHAGTPVTADGGKAAFKALKELKPNVVKTYSQSSDLANMFKSGEIVAAVVGDYGVSMVKSALPSAVYTVPASGTYANYDTISILKNSKNKDSAYRYINYRLSQSVQKKAANPKTLNYAPVNKAVHLDAKTAQYQTYGAVAKRAKTIDFGYVNRHLSTWVTTWNNIMNK